jgi:hypothetical protein
MLHLQAVSPVLLGVLNQLMASEVFTNFRLVGGTALALQEGHRDSVDIDLFGTEEIDEIRISSELQAIGNTTNLSRSTSIFTYVVDNVKVDIVKYPYPWLSHEIVEGNIRMASKEDIAAMKINAITGRGSKKDFIDLHLLLKNFSLSEILSFYERKYNYASIFLALKSLHYFDDADLQKDPKIHSNLTWNKIKSDLQKELKEYMSKK